MKSLSNARQVDLTGGESVYCINQAQMARAIAALKAAAPESPIKKAYDSVKTLLNRNEQAILAFAIIDELNSSVK